MCCKRKNDCWFSDRSPILYEIFFDLLLPDFLTCHQNHINAAHTKNGHSDRLEQYLVLLIKVGVLVDSISILSHDFKSNCGPAEKVERFAKSVFENCCCKLQTLHNYHEIETPQICGQLWLSCNLELDDRHLKCIVRMLPGTK